jgi:hypothetical protein
MATPKPQLLFFIYLTLAAENCGQMPWAYAGHRWALGHWSDWLSYARSFPGSLCCREIAAGVAAQVSLQEIVGLRQSDPQVAIAL